MKKFILSSVLLSGTMLVGTQFVSADEVKKSETPVGIEFKTEGPNEVVPGPYKGVLTLVHKPTALQFGAHSATGALLTAEGINEGKQYLIVSDDRDNKTVGSGVTDQNSKMGDPWKLTAKMDELKSGDETLPSTLVLNLGKAQHYDLGDTSDGNGDYKPNPADDTSITDFADDKHGVTITPQVELESAKQNEVVVMSKIQTGEKSGVASQIESTNLIIQAPKSSAGKQYTSKVTWTLSTGI
jgi:hypothetical protein